MLFMVIERFKNADPNPIGERFNHSGRMLPDGLTYHVSWVDVTGTHCFQVMEAPHRELLDAWISRLDDLSNLKSPRFCPRRIPGPRSGSISVSHHQRQQRRILWSHAESMIFLRAACKRLQTAHHRSASRFCILMLFQDRRL
jgi:hypothetical protein